MKKYSLAFTFLSIVCIFNQAGNSLYLLDEMDNMVPPTRHIHISYPAANGHLPQAVAQPQHFDLFDGLHHAFDIKEQHVANNVHVPIKFHFWKTPGSRMHDLASELFELKARQQNPQAAHLSFEAHDIP